MMTQFLADPATEAAWWGAIGQWAGALGTVAAVVAAFWLPARAGRQTTAEHRAQLAAEAMASVLDLATALEVIRVRTYRRSNRWVTPLGIYMELFARGWPSMERQAAALFRANDVNLKSADFAYAAISGPTARCYAALAQVSLCGSEDLRLAADHLRAAVASLLEQFGDKHGHKKATRELERSIARFRAVTVKITGAAKR